jgi:hypothetical protein
METSEGENSYQDIRNSHNDYDMMEKSNDIGVATGNWGCGAFGGDPEVKTIIQWLAASQVMLYFQLSVYEYVDVVTAHLCELIRNKCLCLPLHQGKAHRYMHSCFEC